MEALRGDDRVYIRAADSFLIRVIHQGPHYRNITSLKSCLISIQNEQRGTPKIQIEASTVGDAQIKEKK